MARQRQSVEISPEVIRDASRRQKAKKPNVRTALDFIIDMSASSSSDCIVWPFARFPVGYGKVGVAGAVMFAHRVMCAAAHGAPPTADHEAAHSCGNGYGGCVNPQHIRWATHAENLSDKIEHGTHIQGTDHYKSKLTQEQVSAIRAHDLSTRGATVRLAEQMGVSHSAISRIRAGSSYKD